MDVYENIMGILKMNETEFMEMLIMKPDLLNEKLETIYNNEELFSVMEVNEKVFIKLSLFIYDVSVIEDALNNKLPQDNEEYQQITKLLNKMTLFGSSPAFLINTYKTAKVNYESLKYCKELPQGTFLHTPQNNTMQ